MAADIQQMGGFYDASQQQAIKAMNAMWQFDPCQSGYSAANKGESMQMPSSAGFNYPFAQHFAQQLSNITGLSGGPGPIRSSVSPACNKKKPTPVPVEHKNEAYYERRKKNNDSARRSREARRAKEDDTQRKVDYLQQENFRLRAEVGLLRAELDRIKYMTMMPQQNM